MNNKTTDTVKKRNPLPAEHYVPDAAAGRRRRKTLLTVLFSCIGVIILIVLAVIVPYLASTAAEGHIVRIPRNATGANLRDTLTRYFERPYADKVMTVMHLSDTDKVERTGAFMIEKGMSSIQAAHLLHSGAQTPIKLTFNGFRDINELTGRVAAKLEADTAALNHCFADPARLEPLGLTPQQRIALFLEDTYEVYWNTSPENLFAKLEKNYRKVWNGTRRKKAEALGLTPAEVMTVCSIVDEETNAAEEKGTIGRLYINRLQKGMRLQADPTIRYALGDFSIRRVTAEHLNVNSSFNTYRNDGLPPAPIRTTSVATIDAVLDSEPSDLLYMCAKEDFSGTHNFAADFATHQANARKYQNALNQRGIK